MLGTHPEYWTLQMYTNLDYYLNGGGSLLYLGGNGLYEKVDYAPDQTGLIFCAGVDGAPRTDSLFRRLTPPMPEQALLGVATENCGVAAAPYAAKRTDHPFFNGTGLAPDELFGTYGLNLGYPAACGLEVDSYGSCLRWATRIRRWAAASRCSW